MKTCCNPEHKEPQPAKYVLDKQAWATRLTFNPQFLCEACAWVWDNFGCFDSEHYDLTEIEEWEEEQLSEEEKRARDWEEYHDREYHRRKDEGLL